MWQELLVVYSNANSALIWRLSHRLTNLHLQGDWAAAHSQGWNPDWSKPDTEHTSPLSVNALVLLLVIYKNVNMPSVLSGGGQYERGRLWWACDIHSLHFVVKGSPDSLIFSSPLNYEASAWDCLALWHEAIPQYLKADFFRKRTCYIWVWYIGRLWQFPFFRMQIHSNISGVILTLWWFNLSFFPKMKEMMEIRHWHGFLC